MLNDDWTEAELMKLYRMVMHPTLAQRWRNRRARIAFQREWLAKNAPPSRLDREDHSNS